jgi:hypothetical protein
LVANIAHLYKGADGGIYHMDNSRPAIDEILAELTLTRCRGRRRNDPDGWTAVTFAQVAEVHHKLRVICESCRRDESPFEPLALAARLGIDPDTPLRSRAPACLQGVRRSPGSHHARSGRPLAVYSGFYQAGRSRNLAAHAAFI